MADIIPFRFAIGARVTMFSWPRGTVGKIEARFVGGDKLRYVVAYRIDKVAGTHYQVVTENQLKLADE